MAVLRRLLASFVLAATLTALAAAAVSAAPTRLVVIENVECDNGETVDIAFIRGSAPHSVFFVVDGDGMVLPLLSYVFTDVETSEVLLAATHPTNVNQPTTTCAGIDPNFDPFRGIEAEFTIEVIFVPAN